MNEDKRYGQTQRGKKKDYIVQVKDLIFPMQVSLRNKKSFGKWAHCDYIVNIM